MDRLIRDRARQAMSEIDRAILRNAITRSTEIPHGLLWGEAPRSEENSIRVLDLEMTTDQEEIDVTTFCETRSFFAARATRTEIRARVDRRIEPGTWVTFEVDPGRGVRCREVAGRDDGDLVGLVRGCEVRATPEGGLRFDVTIRIEEREAARTSVNLRAAFTQLRVTATEAGRAMRQFADTIAESARHMTPVDTGLLRRSAFPPIEYEAPAPDSWRVRYGPVLRHQPHFLNMDSEGATRRPPLQGPPRPRTYRVTEVDDDEPV